MTATTRVQPRPNVTNAYSAQLQIPTMPPEPKTKSKEKDNQLSVLWAKLGTVKKWWMHFRTQEPL